MRTIAVIGGGVCGTLTTLHLLKGISSPWVRVVLIEKNKHVGRGVAYGTEDDLHRLNVPAMNMSLFSDKPSHFVEWLKKEVKKIQNSPFIPVCFMLLI